MEHPKTGFSKSTPRKKAKAGIWRLRGCKLGTPSPGPSEKKTRNPSNPRAAGPSGRMLSLCHVFLFNKNAPCIRGIAKPENIKRLKIKASGETKATQNRKASFEEVSQ